MMSALVKLPRYEAYKDSGIEWLGEIPEHWDLVPIRSIFKFRNEKNDPIKTNEVLSLSIANGVTRYSEERRSGNKRKDDLSAYKIAHSGDIVMNSMNVIVGAVGMSQYYGAISPVYYALYSDSTDILISFYEQIFQNEGFQRGLLKFGKGILIKLSGRGKLNTIRMKISQNDLKVLYFPKPPKHEQITIANFLDKKTAQLDEAIAIKEQQISLLKEHKQITIQQAVTQGINPDVTMRDSGVDWIGQIPEHWEVKRIKHLAIIQNGQIDPKKKQHKNKILIAPNHIESNTGQILYKETAIEQSAESGKYPTKKGALLYSKIRPELRKSCIAEEDGMCSADMYSIMPHANLNPQFMLLIFLGEKFNGYMVSQSLRVAMPKVNRNDVSNYWITIPPIQEQLDIINKISTLTNKIQSAINLQNQQIQKLKEYKTTLINSAVTGKIKIPQN